MSKEEKEKKEEKSKESKVESQKYNLSDAVLESGYEAMIPKRIGKLFKIGFDVNLQGQKNNAYASVMEPATNPARGGGMLWKWTGQTYLEDLTDEQLWVLAIAKVIVLSKDQEKLFKEKFYSK